MLKRWLIFFGFVFSGLAHAFVPTSGTWVVSNELNGAPGRGLAIDVQSGVLVMQMYAYEQSGQPTFYMATGALVNNQVTTKLGRYTGGRYLGSGPMSGVENGSPGNVRIRFTSGTDGFITLPGETEVAIKRFDFGFVRSPAAIAGSWVYAMQFIDGTAESDLVQLNTSYAASPGGTGWMADESAGIGCEYLAVDDGVYNMRCLQFSGASVRAGAKIKMVGNEGEGIVLDSTGRNVGSMYVRKLIDPQGNYLGSIK